MLKLVSHDLAGADSGYRTEDVRFSPSGRRLALAATQECVPVYAVDVDTRPIKLRRQFELRSDALSNPHGLDWIDEDTIVVANRNADLQFYRLPGDGDGSPCVIEALTRAMPSWFGPVGAKRTLRGRELFCGPGSVRIFGGLMFVCCNYESTLSVHAISPSPDGIEIDDIAVIARDGFQIIDGVAPSRDSSHIALSDHDHHRIVVCRREGVRLGEKCADDRLRYPHGLCFDPESRTLYCVDAGSPYLFAFTTGDDWASDVSQAAFALKIVGDETIAKTQSRVPEFLRPLEGGAKGIDLHPAGRVLATTCENQPLAFFERVP